MRTQPQFKKIAPSRAIAAGVLAVMMVGASGRAQVQNPSAPRALIPTAVRFSPSAIQFISEESVAGTFVVAYPSGLQFFDRDGRELASWPPSPMAFSGRKFGDTRPVVLHGGAVEGMFAVTDDQFHVHVFNSFGRLVRSYRTVPVLGNVGSARILSDGTALALDARGARLHFFSPLGVPIGSGVPLESGHVAFFQPILNPAGLIVASLDLAAPPGRILFLGRDGTVVRSVPADGITLRDAIVHGGGRTAVARLVDFRARLLIFSNEGEPKGEYQSRTEGDFRPFAFPSGGFALAFTRSRAVEFISPNGQLVARATADGEILRAFIEPTSGVLLVATRSGAKAYSAEGAELASFPGVDAENGFVSGRQGNAIAIGERSITRISMRDLRAEVTLMVPASLRSAVRIGGAGDDQIVATLRSDWDSATGRAPAGLSLIFLQMP